MEFYIFCSCNFNFRISLINKHVIGKKLLKKEGIEGSMDKKIEKYS